MGVTEEDGASAADSIFYNNSLSNQSMDSKGFLEPSPTKPWPLLRQSLIMVVILSFAYVVVFFLSIVNNSLVVAVIYRNPQLRTITNIFIANLAVADILVSILVLPITLLGNLFEGKCRFSLSIEFSDIQPTLPNLSNPA